MNLRPSTPEDQAGVTHAISPIWMKLGQIKGPIQKLYRTKCVGFATFPLGVRPPPWFFAPNPKNSTKIRIKIKHRCWLQNTMNFILV